MVPGEGLDLANLGWVRSAGCAELAPAEVASLARCRCRGQGHGPRRRDRNRSGLGRPDSDRQLDPFVRDDEADVLGAGDRAAFAAVQHDPGIVRASDPGVGMGIEFTDLENQVQERLQSLLEKMDTSFAAAAGTTQESISTPLNFNQSTKN